MKKIVHYLKDYFSAIPATLFFTASLFTAMLIFFNYHFGLNQFLYRLGGAWQYAGWYAVFLIAFSFGYVLQSVFLKPELFKSKKFMLLLLTAPAIFAWKMAFSFSLDFSTDVFKKEYWNAVVYWPFKAVVLTLALLAVHALFDKGEPFYGVSSKSFVARPYFIMLLLMVPLVAAASTQKDFLRMYPRLQNVAYLLQPARGWHKLLYELSYGTDFFSIELFFRGFLVLAFARWAGKGAVLPMAVFYCTIHFGKPLGECISSYFGGIILGVVAYHTRSVWGGLMVHVGIAWLMELGGFLGHSGF